MRNPVERIVRRLSEMAWFESNITLSSRRLSAELVYERMWLGIWGSPGEPERRAILAVAGITHPGYGLEAREVQEFLITHLRAIEDWEVDVAEARLQVEAWKAEGYVLPKVGADDGVFVAAIGPIGNERDHILVEGPAWWTPIRPMPRMGNHAEHA